MAIYSQIERILQTEADIYNLEQSRKKKAEVVVPKGSNPGRGNDAFGERCVYNIFLRRIIAERVVSISHNDGDAYFPASAIIRVHFSQEKYQDEAAVSPEHLAARLREILATEEWDAEGNNES